MAWGRSGVRVPLGPLMGSIETLDNLYDGLVERFHQNGMETVGTVGDGCFKRWSRIADFGGGSNLSFSVQKGVILEDSNKGVGLILGLPITGNFLTPRELDFGISLRGPANRKISDEFSNLYRLIKYHSGDWSFGRFYENLQGEIVPDCWANEYTFGGDDLRSVGISSAWVIVSRTVENGFKK